MSIFSLESAQQKSSKKYSDPTEKCIKEHDKYLPKCIKDHLNMKTCLACNHVGKVRFDTIRHILHIHLKLSEFPCDFCPFTVKQLSRLKTHYFACHDGQVLNPEPKSRKRPKSPATSEQNEESITQPKKRIRELESHQPSRKAASRVRLEFESLKDLEQNGKQFIPVIQVYFECKICFWKFDNVEHFRAHKEEFHSTMESKNPPEEK